MQIETKFELKQRVKIKANNSEGMVTDYWQSYQHKEMLYQVEYVVNSTNEVVSRYFPADELESVGQ